MIPESEVHLPLQLTLTCIGVQRDDARGKASLFYLELQYAANRSVASTSRVGWLVFEIIPVDAVHTSAARCTGYGE